MGRRHHREQQTGTPPVDFEIERTLAAAEEDSAVAEEPGAAQDVRCTCGSNEFVLEAYVHVVDGHAMELVEVETLSCPQCGREYEAIQAEDGRLLRGEFLGTVDLDEQ
jgi:hypothetical protein